jgi:peptide/nickel transport system permease protein
VIVGLAGPLLATIVSLIIGVVSGYSGGKLDLIVQRLVDSWMALPSLIVLIVLMILLGPSVQSVIIAVGVTWGIGGSRLIRSAVIGVKENVYVAAAEAIGCSTPRILIRHILPNIMAPTIILFTTRVPGIIITEATLSFLGFGIPPPFPSWGGMLSGPGRDYAFDAPWIALYPGLALALVVYSINMFGDAVRDLVDPRLRGGVGRYGVRVKKEATVKSEPSPPKGLTKQ